MVNMFKILEEHYKGKNVLLTGHTGFKGAWLLKILSMVGANVTGYALEPQNQTDLYKLLDGDTLCNSTIADIRNREAVDAITDKSQPDYVFHLAAQPLVRLSYDIPVDTFEVNAIGTANLLDALRRLKKQCIIIIITTDKVYYNNEWIYPYREIDRLGGYDPYSASKACTELIVDSFRKSFFNIKEYESHKKAIAVARAGNVIGGGDWSKDRLIPDIAKAFIEQKEIIIRNPNSIRPWQHVLEPLVGYLKLGIKMVEEPVSKSEAYNFGPHIRDTLTVKEMLTLALKAWGKNDYNVVYENAGSELHEAGLLKLDITKARVDLDWQPKINAEESVKYTMDWYREFKDNRTNIAYFSHNQILKYLSV